MEIWIGRDGERYGPYSEDEIRGWLRDGTMSGADLAWRDGLKDWQPLSVLFPDAVPEASDGEAPHLYRAPAAPVPPAPPRTAPMPSYAGFWKRVMAYILDALVMYLPNLMIDRMMGGAAAQEKLAQTLPGITHSLDDVLAAYQQYYDAMWPAMLLGAVLTWLYFAVCESSPWQATLGKLALGMHVTDLDGRRISFPRALGRYVAKIPSFLLFFVGVLMVGWTPRKQGLHDYLAGTLVVNGRAGQGPRGGAPEGGKRYDGSLRA